MCKPFPPPLVRGGVFLVGLETKYRDIADGNSGIWIIKFVDLADVRYQVPRYSGWKHHLEDDLVTWDGSQIPSTAI